MKQVVFNVMKHGPRTVRPKTKEIGKINLTILNLSFATKSFILNIKYICKYYTLDLCTLYMFVLNFQVTVCA